MTLQFIPQQSATHQVELRWYQRKHFLAMIVSIFIDIEINFSFVS